MKDRYDFAKGRRGAVISKTGKTRVTMFLDDDVLAAFRDRAEREGRGYQTLINEALRVHVAEHATLDAERLRAILREELKRALKR